MKYYYEFVKPEENLPVSATLYEVYENELHWHKYMEVVMVLSGSVKKRIGAEEFLLKTGDVAFVNSNEIHNTSTTDEPNLLLAMQINPDFFKTMYPSFLDFYFDCNEFLLRNPNIGMIKRTRKKLAQIAWEMVNRNIGYRSKIGSILYSLTGEIFSVSPFYAKDDRDISSDDDLTRLQRIIEYIDENLHRRITLKEIADMEHLNYHYISHFIKRKLGISFQQYLIQTRMSKALYLLFYSEKTTLEIANQLGYKSLAAFNKVFRDEYGTSPSEYHEAYLKKYSYKLQDDRLSFRKQAGINIFYNTDNNFPKSSRTYFDVDRTNALELLFAYLDQEIEEDGLSKYANSLETEATIINVDILKDGQELKPYWQKLITATRAAEGLRQEWQEQLKELQKGIGFEYIRFHGLLSDDMMVYRTSPRGEVSYNWIYVDDVFDKLLAQGIKPFVELSFMPEALKSNNHTAYWWRANVSPPSDISKWQDLIRALIKHLINRYGLQEVESWYFEVWNEPELQNVYWTGTKEEYFAFYKDTASVIKEISPQLKVGGPSITHQAMKDGTWLEDFLNYCKDEQVAIDFISLHIYPERYPEVETESEIAKQLLGGDMPFVEKMQFYMSMPRVYHGPDITYESLIEAREKITRTLGYLPELCITEWNASASPRNLIHDTAFVATYIVHNVVKCIGLVDMLGYWTFTDINEEIPLGVSHFHGNYGLINKDGIKKAGYFAYYLLAKLGDRLLTQDENYIVTKNESGIQILAYNFTYFNDLFISGDISLLKQTDRYKIYAQKLPQHMKINLTGLEGDYKVTRYQLNRKNGSAYDKWIQMGAIEEMTAEEINYLKNDSHPKLFRENITITGEYYTDILLPVHGIELLEIKKVY